MSNEIKIMNSKLYLGGSEDEMEFMPIIPLNEDGENNDEQAIPAELPLLPLRNTVLFPGVVLPITVGRDKSIKAVNDAYKTDKLVGVVSQKDSSVEEPTVSDLVDIGTVANPSNFASRAEGNPASTEKCASHSGATSSK